jgi:CHRD domain
MSNFRYLSASAASVAVLTSTIVAIAPVNQAQAAVLLFTADLRGANEVPPNPSLGVGIAQVTIDDVLNTLFVQTTFSGLTGRTTGSRINRSGSVGSNTAVAFSFTGFPSGVTSGTYSDTLALSSTVLAGLENELLAGNAYFNVSTEIYPGGEIRGTLVRQMTSVPSVPEPFTLIGTLISSTAAFRMRKKLSDSSKA